MKKVIFTCSVILFIGLITKLNAQCDLGFSNFRTIATDVQTPDVNFPTNKMFIVDIEFDLKYSEENKFVYLHLYKGSDYPNFFDCSKTYSAEAPKRGQLGTTINEIGKSILDLGFDNSVARGAIGVPVAVNLLGIYGPDNAVELTSPLNSPGITVTKTYSGMDGTDHFVIKNVKVFVNDYNENTFSLKTDVWANDGTNNEAQCTLCPAPIYLNDPSISGVNNCRQFSFTLTSENPTEQDVTCKVYLDMNGNGFNDEGEPHVKTLQARLSKSAPYSSGEQNYTNSSGIVRPLVIIVEGANLANSMRGVTTISDPNEPCGILPVDLRSFSAVRSKQRKDQVQLKWETDKEQNNKGFFVQRRTAGEWQNITFVGSKGVEGNSSIVLAYEYADVNPARGVTQYRLLQVDLDNKSTYSDIKAVLGTEQSVSVLVYPNPSMDGKVNLVFKNNESVKEVVVSDAMGRVVKYYPNVRNNNLTIEGLVSGLYAIKVTDRSTSVSSVEKVVVK